MLTGNPAPGEAATGSRPRALITGISGQDGSYLAELLAGKGYDVFGLTRSATDPVDAAVAAVSTLVCSELTDDDGLRSVLETVQPDEIYHLAAVSSTTLADQMPVQTADVNGLGTLRLLTAVRDICPDARFGFASSSEVFAGGTESPQSETSALVPRNMYGATKAFGQMLTERFRDQFGLHTSSAIFYNHESPRRDPRFLTRKISVAVAAIHAGERSRVALGSLDARRDWGFAGEYVDAMWRMLQQETPSDFVVATGVTHSVEDFCRTAFAVVDLDWRDHVHHDPAFDRDDDAVVMVGDPRRACDQLDWSASMSFEELVTLMVVTDIENQVVQP